MICPKHVVSKLACRMSELKHAEKQFRISRFYGPCVHGVQVSLPSIQTIVPHLHGHGGGSMLCSTSKLYCKSATFEITRYWECVTE